jgi:outer membrane protein assembly factor BamB
MFDSPLNPNIYTVAKHLYAIIESIAMNGSSSTSFAIYNQATGGLVSSVPINYNPTNEGNGIDTDGTNIYLAAGLAIVKYDSSGNQLLTIPVTNGYYGVVRYSGGVIYAGGGYGMPGGYVAAYNATTGAQLWSVTTASGAPVDMAINGDVYVLTSANIVMRINASTGATAWSSPSALGNGSGWSISAVGGNVYAAGGWNGGTYFKQLSTADGSLIYDASAVISAKQIFANSNGVYVVNSGGVAKYNFSLALVSQLVTSIPYPSSIYIYGQQMYWSTYTSSGSSSSTIASDTGMY